MDLFFEAEKNDLERPLAERLRPISVKDFKGQAHRRGPLQILERTFSQGLWPPSLIFWGPPGSGKTTMARLLVARLQGHMESLHGVGLGAKELRDVGEQARSRKRISGVRTLVFIDEIHRLNKAQQDVLLPFCERGDFILIGATTENPAYQLNSALLSRCRIVTFENHSPASLGEILDRAWLELKISATLSPEARDLVIRRADGDARALLNSIEIIVAQFSIGDRPSEIAQEDVNEWLGPMSPRYDAGGDQHYDVISAFIKSVRGSDPDAAIYYLARMLKGGEDPLFIARRLVILASEDIGNGDPRALQVAVAGLQAAELVGLPEAAINLSQVTTYLASAPKSNASYQAWLKAQAEVERSGTLPVPLALRSGQTQELKDLGYGQGYHYSHEGARGFVSQDFLPEKIHGMKFYQPKPLGFEKTIREYLLWLRQEKDPVAVSKADRPQV